jgi:hypothetical protein
MVVEGGEEKAGVVIVLLFLVYQRCPKRGMKVALLCVARAAAGDQPVITRKDGEP